MWITRIHGTVFSGNEALEDGGALYVKESMTSLTNCMINANEAARHGGGVYVYDQYSYNHRYIGCCFVNNLAGANGGGMYLCDHGLGMRATVTNATIAGNTAAEGGGMYVFSISLYLTNSILWGNLATSSGPQVRFGGRRYHDDSNPYLLCCTAEGGTGSFAGSAINNRSYDTIYTLDPLFAETGSGDFTLREGSPCIDAGSADTAELNLPPVDMNGTGRVLNGRVDIGAFESSLATRLQTKRHVRYEASRRSVHQDWFDACGRIRPTRGPSSYSPCHHGTTVLVNEARRGVVPGLETDRSR
jgi:predicted outer membrane repeat protein